MRYKRRHIVGDPECTTETVVETNEFLIEKREWLKIELNKEGDKSVAVIMMNPSKANSDQSDGTVNKVIEFFINPFLRPFNEGFKIIDDIKMVNILNLLPIYNPESSGLLDDLNKIISWHSNNYLESLLDSNIRKVLEIIRDSDYIVLAWGMPDNFPLTLYFEQAARVLQELTRLNKEIFVFRVRNPKNSEYHLTKMLNPPHPSRCKILQLVRVDIEPFYRIVQRASEANAN